MKRYSSLTDFSDDFDVFILDLWGVIHDGQALYPDVLEALQELHKRDKKIVFLSNAPRRASKAAKALREFGVADHIYDTVITSGEATYGHIKEGFPDNTKYYYIGPEKDADILDGLPITVTSDASKASFALVTGFDDEHSTLEEKLPDIEECLASNLTLICANPDLIVVRQNGTRMLCAGVIANEYTKRGGEVTFFGKPYKSVYEKCFSLFDDKDLSYVAIGDSLHTDVAGANNAEITSILVTGGIFQKYFGTNYGELPAQGTIDKLCAEENACPDGVLPAFRW